MAGAGELWITVGDETNTSVPWQHGGDAEEFAQVSIAAVQSLRGLDALLAESAQDLERNAAEQDECSAAVTGRFSIERVTELLSLLDVAPDEVRRLTGQDAHDLLGLLRHDLTFGEDDFDPIHWLTENVKDGAEWVWNEIGVPVINGAAGFFEAMLDNPAATGGMLAGLGLIAVGVFVGVGGVILIPTGIVTLGGGTVAGTGIAVSGGTIIIAGALVAAGSMGILLAESSGNGSDGPAKPIDNEPQVYRPAGPGANDPPRPVKEVWDELPPGKQKDAVRTVGSDAELQKTYDEMARGGEVITKNGYKGQWVRLPDGTEVGLRESSKSGGRTIDIIEPGNSDRKKIHIDEG